MVLENKVTINDFIYCNSLTLQYLFHMYQWWNKVSFMVWCSFIWHLTSAGYNKFNYAILFWFIPFKLCSEIHFLWDMIFSVFRCISASRKVFFEKKTEKTITYFMTVNYHRKVRNVYVYLRRWIRFFWENHMYTRSLSLDQGPLLLTRFTSITSWISKHMHSKFWMK